MGIPALIFGAFMTRSTRVNFGNNGIRGLGLLLRALSRC